MIVELLDAVNRDDVDLAARLARHIRVDRPHPFLECLVQPFQCRDQALAGKVWASPQQDAGWVTGGLNGGPRRKTDPCFLVWVRVVCQRLLR